MTESDRNTTALEGLDAIQRLAEAELKRHYDVDWPGPGPCELTAEETARLHDLWVANYNLWLKISDPTGLLRS